MRTQFLPHYVKRRASQRCSEYGLTLLDLLVGIAALGIVSTAIIFGSAWLKLYSNSTLCMSNIRQLTHALEMYNGDHRSYPSGLPYQTLRASLETYVSHPRIFTCPADHEDAYDSFSCYYAYPDDDTSSPRYVLGCPRHRNHTYASFALTSGNAQLTRIITPTCNGKPISPGSFVSGTITFSNGSEVSADDTPVMLVQSVVMQNDTHYAVLRIPEGHRGAVTVIATGTMIIDIIAPAMVAHIRNATAIIDTDHDSGRPMSTLSVLHGMVEVTPVNAQRMDNGSLSGMRRGRIYLSDGMSCEMYAASTDVNTDDIQGLIKNLEHASADGKLTDEQTHRIQNLIKWLSLYQ